LLFPFYASHNPHVTTDRWSYLPAVDAPFGTDYTVAIATSRPATELIAWLRAHNNKHDAFELPAVIVRTLDPALADQRAPARQDSFLPGIRISTCHGHAPVATAIPPTTRVLALGLSVSITSRTVCAKTEPARERR
jgi:hypothetical protein